MAEVHQARPDQIEAVEEPADVLAVAGVDWADACADFPSPDLPDGREGIDLGILAG
jgi:hypothetical protein